MAFFDDQPLISPFSAAERKKPSPRRGWSSYKTSPSPENAIYRVWGKTRCLHHLKANTTDYFVGDEHVAHVRWRVIEHILTIKKPPAGWTKPEMDHGAIQAQIRAYREKLAAEIETNALPS